MKWEMPLTASASHRPPTPTQIPRLTLAMCGISAVATVNPFSIRVTWYIGKIREPEKRRRPAANPLLSPRLLNPSLNPNPNLNPNPAAPAVNPPFLAGPPAGQPAACNL